MSAWIWYVLMVAWVTLTVSQPGAVWAFILGTLAGAIICLKSVVYGQKKGWWDTPGEEGKIA